ncbi:unnamed protein product [Arctogadus glacialis]
MGILYLKRPKASEKRNSSRASHDQETVPRRFNLIIQFWCMSCDHTDGMPRGEFNIYFASRRGGFVRAEEAVGVALLVIIIASLLIVTCWYFRRRKGYQVLRNPRSGSPGYTGGQYSDASADNKMALVECGSMGLVVPNAPPAYEKLTDGPLPPPYSP